jgi:hypothetical protein
VVLPTLVSLLKVFVNVVNFKAMVHTKTNITFPAFISWPYCFRSIANSFSFPSRCWTHWTRSQRLWHLPFFLLNFCQEVTSDEPFFIPGICSPSHCLLLVRELSRLPVLSQFLFWILCVVLVFFSASGNVSCIEGKSWGWPSSAYGKKLALEFWTTI